MEDQARDIDIHAMNITFQMDMKAVYNETTVSDKDPRKDLPAGFYTMLTTVGGSTCTAPSTLCS